MLPLSSSLAVKLLLHGYTFALSKPQSTIDRDDANPVVVSTQ